VLVLGATKRQRSIDNHTKSSYSEDFLYVNMTFHAAPSCTFKNVLFNTLNFTSASAFSTKISSITDSKKEMTSVYSQKSISAFNVQNILNTADFLCQHSDIYFPFRGKRTRDAAPYITIHTTRIL